MPLKWHPGLNDLVVLLASLYPDPDRARLVIRQAGIDPGEINLAGPSKVIWLRIVEEANRRDVLPALLQAAKTDFPNIDFDALQRRLAPTEVTPPELTAWKGVSNAAQLERITGSQPTFLAVSFLERGLARAAAVARVQTPGGFGTGFVTAGNLLITNHHVIRSAEEAADSLVLFNYQRTADGLEREAVEFRLDPSNGFATSPMEDGDDWTAVRVAGDANATWGAIPLVEASIAVDGFVNIIQHPSGLPKQIAMYHNTVVYADDRRVQYLTDTLPGSSGSPVFDSEWRLVAVHHSGGWLVEPGTKNAFFRNEGIAVGAVLQGLVRHGLVRAV